MDRKTLRIAYYGKGGIGKSTVAANLSAALAKSGKKVLHIGCDPKADSVRPLTGRRIPTALEALNSSGSRPTREQLVFPGIYGISCVEAGGPKAGSGCAGLGITAAMGELERLGVFNEEWDVVAYDVLGDVVCGGFAVPMRKHYADLVYLITSDEYMSLYAANNILKGVAAYSTKTPMLGGIIHNRAVDISGMKLVAEFAERTGARHVAAIPSHHHIRQADYRRAVVSAAFPESDMLPVFSEVSDFLTTHFIGTRPQPLSEEALEDLCCSAFPEEERIVYA